MKVTAIDFTVLQDLPGSTPVKDQRCRQELEKASTVLAFAPPYSGCILHLLRHFAHLKALERDAEPHAGHSTYMLAEGWVRWVIDRARTPAEFWSWLSRDQVLYQWQNTRKGQPKCRSEWDSSSGIAGKLKWLETPEALTVAELELALVIFQWNEEQPKFTVWLSDLAPECLPEIHRFLLHRYCWPLLDAFEAALKNCSNPHNLRSAGAILPAGVTAVLHDFSEVLKLSSDFRSRCENTWNKLRNAVMAKVKFTFGYRTPHATSNKICNSVSRLWHAITPSSILSHCASMRSWHDLPLRIFAGITVGYMAIFGASHFFDPTVGDMFCWMRWLLLIVAALWLLHWLTLREVFRQNHGFLDLGEHGRFRAIPFLRKVILFSVMLSIAIRIVVLPHTLPNPGLLSFFMATLTCVAKITLMAVLAADLGILLQWLWDTHSTLDAE